MNTYNDSTFPYKAGAAEALCEMAVYTGKENTKDKIIPILSELLKDDYSDVKLNVIEGFLLVAKVFPNDDFLNLPIIKEIG